MEADFFRYYGLDLRELLRAGELRRVRRLVAHLPPGCALLRDMLGEEAPWDLTDHLVADVIDVLQGANYQRGRIAGAKGGDKPKPVRRPNPHRAMRKKEQQQKRGDIGRRIKERARRHAERRRRAEGRGDNGELTTG